MQENGGPPQGNQGEFLWGLVLAIFVSVAVWGCIVVSILWAFGVVG